MTTTADFYSVPGEEQVRRLAALARAALPEWGIAEAEVTPVAYRENMTFRVDAGGRRYAFRVHQAGYRSDAQIKSEIDLMSYLDSQGIKTPVVVPTRSGALYAKAYTDEVGEERQCDMFEWIEGRALRESGAAFSTPLEELVASYEEVGRIAASVHNAFERWQRPPGFDRPAWDCDGLFGPGAHLGDFRKLTGISDEQRGLLLDVAVKLETDLAAFGQGSDRWGLSHGDFLAENIFVCEDGMRLLDFDDAGEGWFLMDLVTATFDLAGTPYFDPCLEAAVRGYRGERALPDEHLEMTPVFLLARTLSYLGWCAKKVHMPQTQWLQPLLLAAAEQRGREYLGR